MGGPDDTVFYNILFAMNVNCTSPGSRTSFERAPWLSVKILGSQSSVFFFFFSGRTGGQPVQRSMNRLRAPVVPLFGSNLDPGR